MFAYLFLILALVSLGLLGILHKVADRARCRPAPITVFLFFWAAAMASAGGLFFRGGLQALQLPTMPLGVAVVCGLFAATAIVTFQHAVRYGKISTSWLLINLSTTIPTVLSILVYQEVVGWKKAMSLVLAMVALLLLWMDRKRDAPRVVSSPRGNDSDIG